MGLAGSDNRRNIEAIALLALFLSFSSFSFYNLVTKPVACFPGDIGTTKCPLTTVQALGTWYNMPSTITELMGNTSYRGLLVPSTIGGFLTGVKSLLTVGCITPSNTVGANLQLQYAIYNTATQSITTGFQNIGSAIPIDNSGVNACPGMLSSSDSLLNTTTNQNGYIFRVVGTGGGGLGDNPRFSSVSAEIEIQEERIPIVVISVRSTTSFTAFVFVNIAQTTSTVENFDWIASNATAIVGTDTQHGSNSCTMAVGAFSCSVSTTFTTAFIGTPSVVCTSRNAGSTVTLITGSLDLLSAQTLTV